jgi:hypothetical protein
MSHAMLGSFITFFIFAGVGSLLAARLKVPVRLMTWILMVVGILVGAYIGPQSSLVLVFGVGIYVNWAIQSCCLGMLAVLTARTFARNRASSRAA